MFCPKCGTENRDDAVYCNLCQEPFQGYTQEADSSGAVTTAAQGSYPDPTVPPMNAKLLGTPPVPPNVYQPGMAPSTGYPASAMGSSPSSPYPPPYGPYPGTMPPSTYPYSSAPVMVAQKTPGEATASLILGIVGLFVCPVICSLLAIIFGVKARNMIDASGGYLGGRGQAQAGLVLGIVGMAIGTIITIIYIIALAAASSSSSIIPIIGMS